MSNKKQENLNKLFIQWAAEHNLGNLVLFQNVVRDLIKGEFQQYYKSNDIDEKKYAKDLEVYDSYLTQNTFLMIYSHLEEFLYLLSNKTTDPNKKGLDRFILPTIDKNQKHWNALLNAQKIRNCLLHSNGRISFVNKSDKRAIANICKNKRYFHISQGDKLKITNEYLVFFKNNVDELIKASTTYI